MRLRSKKVETTSQGGIKMQGPRQRATLDFSLDELYILINGLNEMATGLEKWAVTHKCSIYGRKAEVYRTLAQKVDLCHSALFDEQNPRKFEYKEGNWSLAK